MDGVGWVSVSPGGKNVYTSSISDTIAIGARDPETGTLRFISAIADGVNGVDGIGGGGDLFFSPDGLNVYVPAHSEAAIATFRRNPDTGLLTFLHKIDVGRVQLAFDPEAARYRPAGPTAGITSPDGKFVYLATTNFDAIFGFARDASSGALSLQQVLPGSLDPSVISSFKPVAASPEGVSST